MDESIVLCLAIVSAALDVKVRTKVPEAQPHHASQRTEMESS